MFERSNLGISNRSIFLDVQYIVYVEGGKNENHQKTTLQESFDGLFWKKALKAFRPEIKCKIIPRGSKTNLLELSSKILNNEIRNSIVGLDRDYDELDNSIMNHNNILYTYGYSFENDIFYEKFLKEIFDALCPICEPGFDASNEIDIPLNRFKRQFFWPSYADYCAKKIGRKFIDRKKPNKYLSGNDVKNPPTLLTSVLLEQIKKNKPR